MALQKIHEQAGFTAEYWFLKQLTILRNGHDSIYASLEPYKDLEQRQAGNYAVGFPTPHFKVSEAASTIVTLDGVEMTRADAIAKLGYDMIKEAADIEAQKTEDKNEELASFANASDI